MTIERKQITNTNTLVIGYAYRIKCNGKNNNDRDIPYLFCCVLL